MIQTEKLSINEREFIRTWSDAGKMIVREGVLYEEAVDPAEFGWTYTETDEPIEVPAEDALRELTDVLYAAEEVPA